MRVGRTIREGGWEQKGEEEVEEIKRTVNGRSSHAPPPNMDQGDLLVCVNRIYRVPVILIYTRLHYPKDTAMQSDERYYYKKENQ